MAALAQAARPSLSQELIEHAVASIRAADTFSRPFPHIFFATSSLPISTPS